MSTGRFGRPLAAGRMAAAARCLALLAVSVLISLTWSAPHLPAALPLRPMIGGIVLGVSGQHLFVPRWSYLGAQAIIGALVAAAINPSIVATLGQESLLFAVVIAAILVGAAALGWLISRSGLIPGATAAYGTSPGAASAMPSRRVATNTVLSNLVTAYGIALAPQYVVRGDNRRRENQVHGGTQGHPHHGRPVHA